MLRIAFVLLSVVILALNVRYIIFYFSFEHGIHFQNGKVEQILNRLWFLVLKSHLFVLRRLQQERCFL